MLILLFSKSIFELIFSSLILFFVSTKEASIIFNFPFEVIFLKSLFIKTLISAIPVYFISDKLVTLNILNKADIT